ncbi:hypothetical protein CVS47_00423 [Microbacterium lemovicicum]|uniref:Lipoprotein LprB n=1 Tax=Microbacterium lemovicicum TaxID=1072463 RepID=A0A3Q9IWA1_9MICO|nr:hypothetical protein [Microbacterium lemovicicum]AZS35825.1 hypothetical protein CVS47_00423 [Microbacterium lemovicicum]
MGLPAARAVAAASALLLAVLLPGCVAEPGTGPAGVPGTVTVAPTSPAPSASPVATPSATPTARVVSVPDDCRGMLSESVLAQLEGTPLNDPAMGPSGTQTDGSLICIWRNPSADTTGLVTTVSRVDRGPALDSLNDLATTQGFSCYTPDGGTRCEKTWQNTQYPVQDGRTLFYRDGILIDTMWSNLAPSGYTDSVIAHIFG